MKDDNKVYLTAEGLEKLKTELDELKNVKRPEIIQSLKEARALGDLSENAEYDAARSAQAECESRIAELESMIENVEVISDKIKKDKVNVGVTVTIEYVDDNEKETYTIVGSKEVDLANNKISNESPIAQAIIGGKVGDTKTVNSPGGSYDVKIVEIA
ncbi:MAG: transcription elongation factor GreA [Bacilli bacterium]|nr:transcription elongation factor GreA [Bacilli bacterium]